MGKWKHRLLSAEPDTLSGVCSSCGPVSIVWHSRLWRCSKGKHENQSRSRTPEYNKRHRQRKRCGRYVKVEYKYKGDVCGKCGFVPKHSCQLDIDHIDGNPINNDPSNLQTLCANCHRLKTYFCRDWDKRKPAA